VVAQALLLFINDLNLFAALGFAQLVLVATRTAAPPVPTLDQESPGSSPGGAMKPGNDLTVVGLRLFTRLP
jgi:hypothetical protein